MWEVRRVEKELQPWEAWSGLNSVRERDVPSDLLHIDDSGPDNVLRLNLLLFSEDLCEATLLALFVPTLITLRALGVASGS